jgi:excisionase family DNA binding protein
MTVAEVGFETGDVRLAYRVQPFCRSLGIGSTKFYELVRDGKIKTVITGGRRLVPADEAQRLVREGCE